MDKELLSCDWIVQKVRDRKEYAQNLYAAMCNMRWIKYDVIPLLKDDYWSCTWRYSGGIVAEMSGEGDYIDWYCSGIQGDKYDDKLNFVPEGTVTEEIANDLKKLGWIPSEWPEDDNI